MTEKQGRVLAIDYGERRLGLAISDREQTMALPLKTIDTRREDLLKEIRAVIQLYDVQTLVVGDPLRSDGSVGPSSERVRQFAQTLQEHFGLPVILVDERLTSQEAIHRLVEAGGTRKEKGRVDAVAAMLILESYLQQRRQDEA